MPLKVAKFFCNSFFTCFVQELLLSLHQHHVLCDHAVKQFMKTEKQKSDSAKISGYLAPLNRFIMCQCQHREGGWRSCPEQGEEMAERNKPAPLGVTWPLEHMASSSNWVLS